MVISEVEIMKHEEMDGDRPLIVELYEQFNKWFYEMGTAEDVFSVEFSKLTCNLACQGKSKYAKIH
jgi:hypothetical protein